MKRMKRFLYLCLFVIAMRTLGACGKKSNRDTQIPDQLNEQLKQQGEGLLTQLYQMDEKQLAQVIDSAQKSDQAAFIEGLKNFKASKETVGALKGIDDTKVTFSDGNYVVKIKYTGDKRKSEMTLGFDSKTNNVSVFSITPKYSVAENMEKAALNTVLGMGTVFVILIFISFLISLFKHINTFENKFKSKAIKEPVKEVVDVKTEGENLCDDLELVAVITAAIAEFSGNDASSLIVRSIKRVKR